MSLPDRIEDALMWTMDKAMEVVPRVRPATDLLKKCQIVAHRGAHAGESAKLRENTLPAFEKAVTSHAWAIEVDIRWTADGVPVVHHDSDCKRVHHFTNRIHETKFSNLRKGAPEIPTLEEVVKTFKGRAHLMIELKRKQNPWTHERLQHFREILMPLEPERDYHLMSLETDLLLKVAQKDFFPKKSLLPIGTYTFPLVSKIALREGLAGITGHYALLSDTIIQRHRDAGQKVGTGFISSRSVLFRELNRGVHWIFTNHAPEVAALIKSELTSTALS
jgi:glycerophosphoryl diester phosphodiesterase